MKDLTGKLFGQLTVIEYDGFRNHHTYWKCQCSCGNETSVEQTHLLNGHTKSCGCYRRSRQKPMDLTGHVYSRLTVLDFDHAEGRYKYWKCRCECGNVVVCNSENLRGGNIKSCGCLQRETRKQNMKKAIHFYEDSCVEKIRADRLSSQNTSGYLGVFRRENGKWRAAIDMQKRTINLGSYEAIEDAVNARKQAEQELYIPYLERYEQFCKQQRGKETGSFESENETNH